MGTTRVKICGLTEPRHVAAATEAGAAYVGFVFFPGSPRNLTPEAASALAVAVPPGVAKVALTVDASDAQLDAILDRVPVDMLQLHGHETPERVAEVRDRFGLPVMKALGIAGEDDLAAIDDHARAADQLLIDARPPRDGALPGGNGIAFDWRLIAGRRWRVPVDAGRRPHPRHRGRGGAPDRGAAGRRLLRDRDRAGRQGCGPDPRLPRRRTMTAAP